MKLPSLVVIAVLLATPTGQLPAQQVADTAFRPPLARPAFPSNEGPTVLLDEAHHNFHTIAGRYSPFVDLLRRDGFVVLPNRRPFLFEHLRQARVLVIANALPDTAEDWILPTRSAFTSEEVKEVERWVLGGGSLLLIADHMPFAGAAESLAEAFGILFMNAYAVGRTDYSGRFTFRRTDGSLAKDLITDGTTPAERIDSIVSFTGQAFRAVRPVRSLMTVDSTLRLFFTVRGGRIAGKFDSLTPNAPAAGLLQGAVLRHGRGRVAVFGEAAMFSAQETGPARRPMGMNHSDSSAEPSVCAK